MTPRASSSFPASPLGALQTTSIADELSTLLANLSHPAFSIERPAVTSLKEPADLCVIDNPVLSRACPESSPFDHRLRSLECSAPPFVVAFDNLSGDARLISPCKHPNAPAISSDSAHTHIATFIRKAPREQQRNLWKVVADSLEARVLHQKRSHPVWLSTAGEGVFWLHVRLDSRPRYYKSSYKALTSY